MVQKRILIWRIKACSVLQVRFGPSLSIMFVNHVYIPSRVLVVRGSNRNLKCSSFNSHIIFSKTCWRGGSCRFSSERDALVDSHSKHPRFFIWAATFETSTSFDQELYLEQSWIEYRNMATRCSSRFLPMLQTEHSWLDCHFCFTILNTL